MARYTAWKTVIGGTEKKHRSENATYKFLNERAAELADGTEVGVFVQEQHAGDRWYEYERLVARAGSLGEA